MAFAQRRTVGTLSGKGLRPLLAMALLLSSALASEKGAPPTPAASDRYEAHASIMGTVFSIAAYGPHRGRLASTIEAAFEEGRRIDALISNYLPESELSRLNREAARGPLKMSGEMAEFLSACLGYSEASEGAFDITVGALMDVWGFYKGSGKMPNRLELAMANRKTGWRQLRFDRTAHTVEFLRPGLELDPGGIGKGYAVDKIVDVLRQAGIERAFVSTGGSSMYALGTPLDEPRGWSVKIRNPWNRNEVIEELFLKNESLSTSGSYEKFFEAGGKIYSHIMDPRTGEPARGAVAVSVRSPTTLDSEAWATAFFVNGWEWTQAHAPADFDVFFCREDKSCAWVPREK